jgi:hypothetical protein
MGVDNATALKQVRLMIHAPSLTQLGAWRLTPVLPGTVAPGIGHAAAVLRGPWGAVTRPAHHRGESRTTVSTPARRVLHAVASAQEGGRSDERLTAANAARWQAWSDAEALREATQRACAGSGCGLGWRLSQIVTW